MNVKRMATSIVTVMMVVTIFGMNGAMADGQDAYGTKVAMCDVDDTYRLNQLPAVQQIMWVDRNADVVYNQVDDVYLDVDGANVVVSPLDIRLTPVTRATTTYPAGSQVQLGELDVNAPLTVPPSVRTGVLDVMFCDQGTVALAPNGLYDLSEPVFIDMNGGGIISINDVRLTTSIGPLPGTKVLGTDADLGNALLPMPNIFLDPSPCRYYDVDGNGNYNAGDHVIFDATLSLLAPPPFGLGSVNDIRLTPYVECNVAPPYPYGSKISESRKDCVHVLGTPNQAGPALFQIGFRDSIPPNGYTVDDAVYLDVAPPDPGAGITTVGDVRLTPFAGGNPAGSQILQITDPDAGAALTILGVVTFRDLAGDGYTPDDPVYVDITGVGMVSINDVILSDGTPSSGAGTPGSKVTAGSSYMSLPLQAMPGGTTIDYFDTNGDGWYSNPVPTPPFGVGDYVFLDVGGQGYSSANDVRLTEPTFGYSFGSKVGPRENCCTDGLIFFPPVLVNTRLKSWDIIGGGFSDDDPVYIDASLLGNPDIVQVDDVRLTPVTFGGKTYNAGTVVQSGDTDELKPTNWMPWDNIRFRDIDGPGYTPTDPVIIDSDGSGTVTPCDVRITSYANFAAGSKVKAGDGDPYANQGLTVFPGVIQPAYFDVNDRAYNGKDYVYLNVLSTDIFVTVNDIRVTGPSITPPPPCPEDLNNDGFVNVKDIIVMMNNWGQCAGCPEDLNNDGFVNVKDIIVVMNNWGPCP